MAKKPTKEVLSKAGRDLRKANSETPVTPKDKRAGTTLQKGRKKK